MSNTPTKGGRSKSPTGPGTVTRQRHARRAVVAPRGGAQRESPWQALDGFGRGDSRRRTAGVAVGGGLVENDDVVEQFASDTPDPALGNAVLPRSSICRSGRPDAEGLHYRDDPSAEDGVAVE